MEDKKLLGEIVFIDNEFSYIVETDTMENALYKKLINGNYICDICQCSSKRIKYYATLRISTAIVKCVICSKSFKYKHLLKIHQLVHQEMDANSLHSCSKCGYHSKWKSNLKTHYIRQHNDEYKFFCEYCDNASR